MKTAVAHAAGVQRCAGFGFTIRAFAATAALLVFWTAPAAGQKKADLTRLVVVGDSLAAGFQNFSLHENLQANGIAALIARQARTPMVLPLIAAPGVPNVLQLITIGPPPVIMPAAGGPSPGRVDVLTQPTNLAVPAAKVQDALTARPKSHGCFVSSASPVPI